MSNKDRPGKSIAFYTDLLTAKELETMSEDDHRSVSNWITVMINREWERRFPRQMFPAVETEFVAEQ